MVIVNSPGQNLTQLFKESSELERINNRTRKQNFRIKTVYFSVMSC